MVGDVLSQAEVESLLSAMEGDAAAKQAAGAARATAADAAAAGQAARKGHAPTTSSGPSASARSRCGRCKRCTKALAAISARRCPALLRSIVEVKLTSVDQLTYSEFVFSLENPTCFNLLRAEPLEGNLILDINPSILYPIIDRLLGGGREPGPLARRPLTEIELRLVSRITNLFLERDARRLGERVGSEAVGRARREQSATGADRAAERSRRADQLRADAGRHSRHDEFLHSVQFDRADRQQAVEQQLDHLRQTRPRPPKADTQISAICKGSLVRIGRRNWPTRRSPPAN